LKPRIPAAFTQRAGLLTSGWYAVFFLALGAQIPFWPAWMRDWGLSQAEVGTYLGLGMVVRVFAATVLPAVADRFAIRRAMMLAAGLTGGALFFAHLFVETRPALLALTLALSLFAAPLGPLGEALGVRAAQRYGFPYAHPRAVGSFAFLVMNVAIGAVVARYGTDAVVWAVTFNVLLAAGFGAIHPGGAAPPGAGLDRSRFREAFGLLRKPAFLVFGIAISLEQASHAVFYAYSTLIWDAQGIGQGTIGMLWAIGVLSEIALMLGPGWRLVERIGPARAVAIAAAFGVIRWGLMALEPGLLLLWPVQCLHALSFGMAHLGAIAFVAAALPPRLQASAQGLYSGLLGGIAFALATLLAGSISAAWEPAAAYWMAMAMSAGALLAVLRLRRVWTGGRLVADQP